MCRKSLYYLLLIIGLLSAGCEFDAKREMLCEWYVAGNSANTWSSDTAHQILRLYPKGVYTQFGAGIYAIGKWRMNEKGAYIHLQEEQGNLTPTDEYLRIELLEPRKLRAGLFFKMPFYASRLQSIIEFTGQKNHSDEDPYQPDLQRWRIKPGRPETDAAIQKRVVQYLHFLESLYQHAIDNDMARISNSWYPSPLLMHFGNGVRMAYSNELDDWNRCFYDSAQAVKGYQVLSGRIRDLNLKSGVNKFERNLDCVQQLLRQIEK